MLKKIIFLDRDGTLIDEPIDKQVDRIDKIKLKKDIIPALCLFKKAGFNLVMISNQDGVGTDLFKRDDFEVTQNWLLDLFQTQGITFDSVLICPHVESDNCQCRKPALGLVMDYLRNGKMDFEESYMIGDRKTDMQLAENMGIKSILYSDEKNWLEIVSAIVLQPRCYELNRVTKETNISVAVDLDQSREIQISTGIGFFDHMLHQLAKHAGFGLKLVMTGDLTVDEHHTVEDTALALGAVIRKALNYKYGINRYGFMLPMDESLATVAIDLSGRPYFIFDGKFSREIVGGLPTELIAHFFHSFSEGLAAAIHIKVTGENTHHMIECIFKSVGRALKQALFKQGDELPTTKGVL